MPVSVFTVNKELSLPRFNEPIPDLEPKMLGVPPPSLSHRPDSSHACLTLTAPRTQHHGVPPVSHGRSPMHNITCLRARRPRGVAALPKPSSAPARTRAPRNRIASALSTTSLAATSSPLPAPSHHLSIAAPSAPRPHRPCPHRPRLSSSCHSACSPDRRWCLTKMRTQ